MTQELGLPDNVEELSQWFEAIERTISQLAAGNLTTTSSTIRDLKTPPAVSGLRLVSNLNTVTVEWDQVGSLVDFYEIQVSTNPTLALATTYRQRNTQFTYQEGSPGTTYYVRVRARAVAGSYGEWSGTLNTETGLATFSHLNRGAATNPTDNSIDLSGESILDPYNDPDTPPARQDGVLNVATGTYGNTVINCQGGTVLPFTFFEYQLACNWEAGRGNVVHTTIELLRDDVVIDDLTTDAFSSIGNYDSILPTTHTLARTPVLGLGTPDDPGVGVFTYSIRVTAYQNNNSTPTGYIAIQPSEVNIELVELRN